MNKTEIMYQLIDNNRVRKMPEMPEPTSEDHHYNSMKMHGDMVTGMPMGVQQHTNPEWDAYRQYLDLLPIYTISGNHNWKEGQLIPDDEIEIFNSNTYYWAVCDKCGWTGSSENLNGGGQIADTGDYGDVYCPKCNNNDIGENHDYPNYIGTVAIPKQTEPSTGSEEKKATQALKQIEQFSDCGDYAMAIVRMKAIASEAFKSKSIPSEVEEDELWELTKKKLLDLMIVEGKIKEVRKVMSSVAIVFESGSAYWLRLEKQAEVSLD